MKPSVWGKCAWLFLHSVALDYPDNPTNDDKIKYKTFFESLQHILPCEKCKVHMKQNMQTNKLTDKILSDKSSLIKWVIDIHNNVNKSLGKPVLSYEDALSDILKNYYPKNNLYLMSVVSVFVIIILLFCFYYFKN